MRQKRWVFHFEQTGDDEAAVRRLERLAEKGWSLEYADYWRWLLRREEPAKVRYSIAYFPNATDYDPKPTEDQEAYADYCRAAGWELVTFYGPKQYFRSIRPDPTPIETDEATRLDSIWRALWKGPIPAYGLLLILIVSLWADKMRDLRIYPLATLADNGSLFLLALLALQLLCAAITPVDHFIWYWRAKRAVEAGMACPRSHFRLRRVTHVLIAACLGAALALVLAVAGTVSRGLLVLALLALLLLPYAALTAFFFHIRRRGRDRASVKKRFIIALMISLFLTTWLRGVLLDRGTLALIFRQTDQAYADSGEERRARPADPLPVTLEDLGLSGTEADACSYRAYGGSSVLVSYTAWRQTAEAEESVLPDLSYCVADFSQSWAAERCLDNVFWSGPVSFGGVFFNMPARSPVQDPRWGADEVYFDPGSDRSGAGGNWLLRYGDRLAAFSQWGWALTDERVEILREVFEPAKDKG